MSLGGDYQQEVDLRSLFKDVASEYLGECVDPRQAGHLVDRARAHRAVAAHGHRDHRPHRRPGDGLRGAAARARRDLVVVGWRPPVVVPREEDLRRAADVLNAGERVAMLVGQGARGAHGRGRRPSPSALGAGVAKALNGRAVVPDDLPFVTGAIGLLGTKPSADMMDGCDTLLMVGTGLPVRRVAARARAGARRADRHRRAPAGHPLPRRGRPPGRRARRRCARCCRCSSARPTARGARTIEREVAELVAARSSERAQADADPSTRSSSSTSCRARLPDRAILLADSGSATNWWARHLRLRERDGRGAVGHAGDDVPGGALRAGRATRLSPTAR